MQLVNFIFARASTTALIGDYLLVLLIAAALFAVPTAIVITVLGRVLRKQDRKRWYILLVAVLGWNAITIWEAYNIALLATVKGPDSGWIGMELGFVRIPRWLVFLAPSLPALVMLYIKRPRRDSDH